MQTAVSMLQAMMDRRIAFRLAIIVAGMFLAQILHEIFGLGETMA